MTMPDHDVLSEIARLEAQMAKLQRELAALRRRVEGQGQQRRATRAFSAPPAPRETPGVSDPTVPAFAPPAALDPMPVPSPSVPVVSETVPSSSSRRASTPNVGLSQPPPPHSHLTPSRRNALPEPEGGRYGFVGEERKRRR